MSSKQARERGLLHVLAGVETAAAVSSDLVRGVLVEACPRHQAAEAARRVDRVSALIDAEAWVELGLLLLDLELPDWSPHRLSRDDSRWSCSICVRGLAMNWIDDVVEVEHEDLALALFSALIQGQIRKLRGAAPTNVTVFRDLRRDRPPLPPRPDGGPDAAVSAPQGR
jgi:hypothetical protein